MAMVYEHPAAFKRDHRIWAGLIGLSLSLALPSWAQEPKPDLTEISIENLLDMRVTIASKQSEKISDTPAAVYVVTQEDIQRFGFTSIPEALRMVPGLDVARISGGIWAISARGFNKRYSDKLLVLVDGRSIYSPTFSGVVWDVQDVPIEDIDRIEVIRGPGAALWGANAVNGVINILTKSAQNTKGGLVVAGSGSEDLGFSSFRWGGNLGQSGAYRFSGKAFDRAALLSDSTGRSGFDRSHLGALNFRADWGSGQNAFTTSGSYYRGYIGSNEPLINPLTPPGTYFNNTANNSGGDILGRWTREHSRTSNISLQFYVQQAQRIDLRGNENNVTTDIDFQHRLAAGSRNNIIWGVAYRRVFDRIDDGLKFSTNPDVVRSGLASAFVQDEIALPGHIRFTMGAKAEEHTSEMNDSFEPNVRAIWTPVARHSFWASAARSANTVSRIQTDAKLLLTAIPTGGGPNAILTLNGNPNVKAPVVNAFEAGYRYEPRKKFYVDLATFYDAYERLYTNEPGTPVFVASASVPHEEIPLFFNNKMNGETYGAEAAASFSVNPRWKITGSYSFLRMQLHRSPDSHDAVAESNEGISPRNQFQIRNSYDLTSRLQLNTALYFTGGLPAIGVPSHSRLDFNVGWKVSEKSSVSFGVQNALSASHSEFIDETGSQSTQVRRSAYAKIQWHF